MPKPKSLQNRQEWVERIRLQNESGASVKFPIALSIIGRGFCVRFPLSAHHLPSFLSQARALLFSNTIICVFILKMISMLAL